MEMTPPIDLERTMNIQIPALEWTLNKGAYCRHIHGVTQYIRATHTDGVNATELELENIRDDELHWVPLLNLRIKEPLIRRLQDFFNGIYFMDGQDPYRCLILTLLTQNKTAERARWTFNAFGKKFGDITPQTLSAVDVAEVSCLLYSCGPHRKANYIVATSQEIVRRWDGDMSWIYADEAHARQTLLSLPGVGPKTADCVLLFAGGHDIVPIDTHVERVARRLGFTEQHALHATSEVDLEKINGTEHAKRLAKEALESVLDSPGKSHLLLLQHGFEFCRAKTPNCLWCPICHECNSKDNRCKVNGCTMLQS